MWAPSQLIADTRSVTSKSVFLVRPAAHDPVLILFAHALNNNVFEHIKLVHNLTASLLGDPEPERGGVAGATETSQICRFNLRYKAGQAKKFLLCHFNNTPAGFGPAVPPRPFTSQAMTLYFQRIATMCGFVGNGEYCFARVTSRER